MIKLFFVEINEVRMKKSPQLPTNDLDSLTESYQLIASFIENSRFYHAPTKDNNLEKLEQFLTAAKAQIDRNPAESHSHKHLIALYNDIFRLFTALKQSGLPEGSMAYDNYTGQNVPIHTYIGKTIKVLYRNITDPKTIPTPEITNAVQQVNRDPSILHVQQGLERLLSNKFKFVSKQSHNAEDGISLVLSPGCIQDVHKEWFIKKLNGQYRFEFEPVADKAGHSRIVIRHVECQKQIEQIAAPLLAFTIESIEKGERLEVSAIMKNECHRLIMLRLFDLYPNLNSLKKIDTEKTSQIGFIVGNQLIDKILEQNSVRPK